MKISEFMKELYDYTDSDQSHYNPTCDTIKAGDPEKPFNGKVAVSMFPTPDVVRAAKEWGASLLIVHEPTYYDHWDSIQTLESTTGFKRKILDMKRDMLENSGLAVYRYHDHPHHAEEDLIAVGEITHFGLRGTWVNEHKYGVSEFILEKPMTVPDIAKALEKNLGIAHVRICGSTDHLVNRIGLNFGTPGHVEENLEHCELVLTGEISEWRQAEFARDCTQLGIPRAIIVMGHTCSERDGMKILPAIIQQNFPGSEAKYFESGDAYTFTDQL